MVVGRMLSGVHWASDIIGGILLSLGLIMLYYFAILKINKR
jgi:undecaprenyl-diphosphatase